MPRRKTDPAAGATALQRWLGDQADAQAGLSPGQAMPALGHDTSALDQAKLPTTQRAPASGTTSDLVTAVRYTLEELATRAPGNAVEVRVPPIGAVQAITGPTHRRGTPPAIVETDPTTWLNLATGRLSWAETCANGLVATSGVRADLSAWLPL